MGNAGNGKSRLFAGRVLELRRLADGLEPVEGCAAAEQRRCDAGQNRMTHHSQDFHRHHFHK